MEAEHDDYNVVLMEGSEYHEPVAEFSDRDRDYHRALTSLKEEIEAVDWYQQRVSACTDDALRAILAHNRDEEIEHAAMVLEWLRRNMPHWSEMLKTYLFTDESIVSLEAEESTTSGSLGIGRLNTGRAGRAGRES